MKRHIQWLSLSALLLALCGCKSTRQTVEIPVYIHDTTQTVRLLHDSTYIDRWHTVETRGDTVFNTLVETVIRTVAKTDTAYRIVEKPVTVSKTKTVEVEKPLTSWQKFKMHGFWILSAGLINYVLWRTRRLGGKVVKFLNV